MLKLLHILHLIFALILEGRNYYPHFSDEEAEVLRGHMAIAGRTEMQTQV